MKTIGIIGGMSSESTVSYYQLINQMTNAKLGKLHSAKIVITSVDFEQIELLQNSGKWEEAGKTLAKEAKRLESAQCDFIILATNTMHKVASQIESAVSIPFLHIADCIGEELMRNNIKKVGLLGTAYTMEQDFYKDRIQKKFHIEVATPNEMDRRFIHKVIFEELCLGVIQKSSKAQYCKIIDRLLDDGVEGVILGCTEISLLISQEDTKVQLFDTTYWHAKKAVELALKDC